MRKQASLIDNRPTLKTLQHVERKKLMKKVHLRDKVLYNVKIKDITELNDTMLQ